MLTSEANAQYGVVQLRETRRTMFKPQFEQTIARLGASSIIAQVHSDEGD